ncbi:MAG: HAMP domain-containing protein [Planctomycetes bacterium]|nr:HAMP domain-containing protein [Planctomycetota bacterium]
MLSAQRVRELYHTLRFRLALWITFIVFLMVVVTNVTVRAFEHRALTRSYDQFLIDSLEDVSHAVARMDQDNRELLFAELQAKRQANEHQSWFAQVFDSSKKLVWASGNSPRLPAPDLIDEFTGPYDEKKHRVNEKKIVLLSGETYYIRCGYLHMELADDLGLVNRNLLFVTICISLAAPLGAYVIAMRAMRPISQIIETAAHLQPTNLNERLPMRGTGDELDQLSCTINGMLDRLASFIDQNRDFVANAAHELRSPLAAIRSSVEVGLNRSRSAEEYATILTDVIEEIGRLAGLVNRLLILAEGDAGRLAGKEQYTSLDKIVSESIDMFSAVAESRGVRLAIGDFSAAVVPGDETYIRQIVRNLIDNAIKYNRDDGEVIVHLRTDLARKQAVLIVQDTGIGIDGEGLSRIFERFYRADKARTREKERAGFGLGLSICRTILQALHGEITVESTVGRGTTFTVLLPLILDPPVNLANQMSATPRIAV